ncbi:MAG TPA: glycosyltransferase family 4 protein [Steroidobacteraceae bacterium]
MPRVELISDVFHYYYTALALHRQGLLGHYITGPSLLSDEGGLARLGGPLERLWTERRLDGLPSRKVRRTWVPELMRRAIPRLGGSAERANYVHNDWFARRAAMMMQECDVVHFVHSVGWKAARRAKRSGIKVVCDMREEHPGFQERILSEEASHLGIPFRVPGASFRHRVLEEIGLADFIFCPSRYARRTFLDQGIPADRLVVCPYGVDLAAFDASARPAAGKTFRILFLGQICMRKGVHYLLEGFRQAALPDARLILAGPVDPAFRGVLDRYRGSFEETGAVPRSLVRERYLDADVFVMPSLADSYGLVVSEAMSTGLPVIVSENTGMADMITDGCEGYVVPIRDSAAIAERITLLYEHRDRGIAMGAAAMATAQSLDWNNYQEVCADFYRALFLGEKISARPERTSPATSGARG